MKKYDGLPSLEAPNAVERSRGLVSEILRYAIHDGPGIRTLVFLKGCPLSCLWCSNPETQNSAPELAYFKEKCIGCNRCIELCPYHAVVRSVEGLLVTDWESCARNCSQATGKAFACTGKCYSKARRVIGERLTVTEVMMEVEKDNALYERTGGGVTVSGGEPYLQPRFLGALLVACRQKGITTAVETCGQVPWETLESTLDLVDYFFFDIKAIDPELHMTLTGATNKLALDNIQKLDALLGSRVSHLTIRVPIVPGCTDSADNVAQIFQFVQTRLRAAKSIELLAYHRLGRGKYETIGRTYGLSEARAPAQQDIQKLEAMAATYGLQTHHE